MASPQNIHTCPIIPHILINSNTTGRLPELLLQIRIRVHDIPRAGSDDIQSHWSPLNEANNGSGEDWL